MLSKITSLCRQGIGWASGVLVRRRFVLRAYDVHDLEPDEQLAGGWRATGPLPAFFLAAADSRRLPRGWAHIAIEVDILESDSARAWISCDSGAGFTDADRVILPRPNKGKIDEFIRLPDVVKGLRFDPTKGECRLTIGRIEAREISWNEAYLRKMIRYCRGERLFPIQALRAAVVHAKIFGIGDLISWIRGHMLGEHPATTYGPWVTNSDTLAPAAIDQLRQASGIFSWKPQFSILMPVYDTPAQWLEKAIESVRGQAYEGWELCICDNGSGDRQTVSLLERYRSIDSRIKVTRREVNAHISAATNDAMKLATSDYMCLMDSDDVIPANALFEFARCLNEDRSLDVIYSDEDMISVDNVRYDPFFKPDWSPDFLESCNYIGHFMVCRTDLARRIGGFRSKFDGAQDYDFVLRYTEHTRSIRHIRKILYHWRALQGSTSAGFEQKPYVLPRARLALEERLSRQGETGEVLELPVGGWFEVRRKVSGVDSVSIVLSAEGESSGQGAALALAAEKLRQSTAYGKFEILLAEGPLPEQLNTAARHSHADYLLFADHDLSAIGVDWLEAMLRWAVRPGVGVVGARILFPDNTLKHAGLTFRHGLPHYIRLGFPGTDWGYRGSSGATRNCLAVSGASMMIAREAFDKIGGFDAAIGVEYADVDLCLRSWQQGLRNVFTPHAVVMQGGRERRRRHDGSLAAERFRDRWGSVVKTDPFYGANLSLDPPTFEFEAPVNTR